MDSLLAKFDNVSFSDKIATMSLIATARSVLVAAPAWLIARAGPGLIATG